MLPAQGRLGSVIVICGNLTARIEHGLSVGRVARTAAARGAAVQVVGVVPDDPEGDGLLMDMAAERIGHAAVLREPARDLESADLELALRYLPEVRVIVAVVMPPAVIATAAEYAAWSGASLIVLDPGHHGDAEPPPSVADGATIIEAPARDADGTFAGFVGSLAARLDAGATPADAWAATIRELAIDAI